MELNDGYVYVCYGILCTFCILNRYYDKIFKKFLSKNKGLEGRWCGERVREWVTVHQKNVLSVPNYKKTLLHGGLWSLLPYLYHFYRCNPKHLDSMSSLFHLQTTTWPLLSTYRLLAFCICHSKCMLESFFFTYSTLEIGRLSCPLQCCHYVRTVFTLCRLAGL